MMGACHMPVSANLVLAVKQQQLLGSVALHERRRHGKGVRTMLPAGLNDTSQTDNLYQQGFRG